MTQASAPSPNWGSTTKLLVGLVIVGIIAFFLYRFADLIPPLLMIVVLTYLFHPLVTTISRGLNIPWRMAVNLLYLAILILLISLITIGGVGLVQQVQSLIRSIQDIVSNLPTYVENISQQTYQFGPFKFDLRTFNLDLNTISQQLLSFVQPLLGQTGTLVGALAGGAANAFGWTFFILIVSYFVMVESRGLQGGLFKIEVPGYSEDFRRLGNELSRIWNAFLRGQILIFTLATAIYSILLPILGVRYALGIALMAGLAKFLPYIGPAITWVVMGLVTFFQPDKLFDMQPLAYTALVVITTLVIDQIIDSFVTPRIMARTLKVHPAAVLVTALVAANLLGLLGVVIAAPFLATFTLLGRYTMRKLFDLDPWPERETKLPPPMSTVWKSRIKRLWKSLASRKRPEHKSDLPLESISSTQPAKQSLEEDNGHPGKPVMTPERNRAEKAGAKTPRENPKRSSKKPRA